jgi:beta-mannosidase
VVDARPRRAAALSGDDRRREGEQILDERRDLVGLRTIALDRAGDPEGGRHFRFILNGISIFARGAAWLPADMLVGSVTEARYRDLLATARYGHMTMLRIWVGGIYEDDTFYSLCDELGLLGWQDFAFACIDYPDDDPRLRTGVSTRRPTRCVSCGTTPVWRCGAATMRCS